MKSPFEGHQEFNSPQEMLVRFSYVVMLAALVAGLVMAAGGLVTQQWRIVAAGALCLILFAVIRRWLKASGRLEQVESAFHTLAHPGAPVDESQVAELVRLLREWEEQEQRRGSPRFDPWTVQALRHEIRALVESDPALGELFHEFRQHERQRAA